MDSDVRRNDAKKDELTHIPRTLNLTTAHQYRKLPLNSPPGKPMNKKIERWRGFVPDEDLATYAKGAFGNPIGMGARPALLNIDTTWMFVDPQYAMCGREDPALKAALVRITKTFRALGLPIYYSRRDDRSHP